MYEVSLRGICSLINKWMSTKAKHVKMMYHKQHKATCQRREPMVFVIYYFLQEIPEVHVNEPTYLHDYNKSKLFLA